MKPWDNGLDPLLEKSLAALKPAPPRNPEKAWQGRARFLSKADHFRTAVSKRADRRQKGWMSSIPILFDRKENAPMFAKMVSLLVIVSVLLGGTAATAYAAQGSLPDQPLYGLKLFTEDARLGLAADVQARIALNTEFANRRVEEVASMAGKGASLPAPVLSRLQTQLDQALELSAGLDNASLQRSLQQEKQALQQQEQVLQQVQVSSGSTAEPQLAQVRVIVQTRLQLVEDGLADPQQFRNQVRQRLEQHQGPGLPTGQPGQAPGNMPGSNAGPGPSFTRTPMSTNGPGAGTGAQSSATPPGSGYGPGPHATGTPTPGSSYGPGPNSTQEPGTGNGGNGSGSNQDPTGDPGSGNGDGSGNQTTQAPGDGYGPGPQPEFTPTPGSGYGPGPGPEPGSTCTPGAGQGYGSTQEPGSGNGNPQPTAGAGSGGGKNKP